MRHKLIVYFVLAVFLISYASATDTEINVKTLSNVKVTIQVLDPAQVYLLLNSFHVESGYSGEVSAAYVGEEETVDIKVQITENGNQLIVEKFKGVKTGKPVYVTAFIGNVSISDEKEPVVSDVPSQNSSNATNVSSQIASNASVNDSSEIEADKGVTGSAILDKINFPVKWYYILGGIVLILVVGFLIFRFFINRSSSQVPAYNVTKLNRNNMISPRKMEGELGEAHKKIIALQNEVNGLKKAEKIKEAERKIQADKEELERIKKGKDSF